MFWFFFLFLCLLIDQNELLAARQFLEQAAATNIAEFLKALSEVLANVNCSSVARTASGLQLKNHLTSKDASITEQYHKQWLQFPEVTREYIKNNVSLFLLPYSLYIYSIVFENILLIEYIQIDSMYCSFRLFKLWEQKPLVHHQLHSVWHLLQWLNYL